MNIIFDDINHLLAVQSSWSAFQHRMTQQYPVDRGEAFELARVQAALPADALSERSRIIIMYAMCGFANPGSLGIMIGGMGTMAPERRGEIVALGVRSIVAVVLATSMTGAVAALFI